VFNLSNMFVCSLPSSKSYFWIRACRRSSISRLRKINYSRCRSRTSGMRLSGFDPCFRVWKTPTTQPVFLSRPAQVKQKKLSRRTMMMGWARIAMHPYISTWAIPTRSGNTVSNYFENSLIFTICFSWAPEHRFLSVVRLYDIEYARDVP
jgi:hypothetical protein